MPRGLPRLSGLLMLAVVWLAGCSKNSNPTDSGPTNVVVTGVTVTGPTNSLKATETLQLQAAVQPSDANQGVTWASGDTTLATVSASGLVTGVRTGSVTIVAKSTADPTKAGSIDLSIDCPTPREVTSNIDDDTTWENWVADDVCLDYAVRTDLDLTQAVLTIEKGAAVGFDQGRYLMIQGDDAGLVAEGDVNADGTLEPWVLTGTQNYPRVPPQASEANRGWWGGVIFNHAANAVNHLFTGEISFAGDTPGNGIPANLVVDGSSALQITNLFVREGSGYGLSIAAGAELRPGSACNMMRSNTLGAVYAYASVVHFFANDCFYVDSNGQVGQAGTADWIVVKPDEVSGDVEWDAPTNTSGNSTSDVFRVLQDKATLLVSGHLTLGPGVNMQFGQGDEMVVTGGLNAVGTEEDPIVLTGIEKERGYWRGLRFTDTSEPTNVLDRVIIQYGGGTPQSGSTTPADLMVTHSTSASRSKVEVTNSVLSESAGYGLWIRGEDEVTNFSMNTLTANALGPAYVAPPAVDGLLDDGIYSDNDVDVVTVTNGGGINNLVKDATWRNLGVPYRIMAGAPNELDLEGALLRIQPGVEILFGAGMGFSITKGGFLAVMGTAAEPVILRGDDTQWRGIQIHDSQGYFDHTEIDDAGLTAWGGQQPGAVTLTASSGGLSKVTFTADVINGGAPYGTVFTGAGSTFGFGCLAPVFVPSPDTEADHCNNSGIVTPPAGGPRR